jgi:hypothetical protein
MTTLGKDVLTTMNEPLKNRKFIILDYNKYIELIGNKDSLTSVILTEVDIKELNRLIIEYVNNRNRIIEPEVKLGIQKSPHNTEIIKNSKYLPEPTSFSYQLFPVKNSKGQKLVWINGIHGSLVKNENLNNLRIIADERNLNFNFWANLTSREIKN